MFFSSICGTFAKHILESIHLWCRLFRGCVSMEKEEMKQIVRKKRENENWVIFLNPLKANNFKSNFNLLKSTEPVVWKVCLNRTFLRSSKWDFSMCFSFEFGSNRRHFSEDRNKVGGDRSIFVSFIFRLYQNWMLIFHSHFTEETFIYFICVHKSIAFNLSLKAFWDRHKNGSKDVRLFKVRK